MSEIIELGDEYDFVWSFEEPEQVFEFLIELHEEFQLTDISGIKQAFLNQERHLHYMECTRFEELYINL